MKRNISSECRFHFLSIDVAVKKVAPPIQQLVQELAMCKHEVVVKLVPAMCNSKSTIRQHQKDIYKKNNEMSLLRLVMSLHMT